MHPRLFLGLIIALLLINAQFASPACQEGTVVDCTAPNGCPGTKECLGGRWTPCDAPESCGIGEDDFLTVSNAEAGQDVAVLYGGKTGANAFNHQRIRGGADAAGSFTQNVGDVRNNPAGNGMVAFSRRRAPTWQNIHWTKFADRRRVALEGTVGFPITIWIVAAPFNQQSQTAALAAVGANVLYDQERVGLQATTITIRDATNSPNAAGHAAFTGDLSGLQRDVGQAANQINVYWVQTVNGNAGAGVNFDGTPFIVVGAAANRGLLAHELGHAFVLSHVGAPNFDQRNIMHPASNTREFLTEGQAFLMHFHVSSMVNALFNARPTQPKFQCPGNGTESNECPAMNRRIWADGPFLEN